MNDNKSDSAHTLTCDEADQCSARCEPHPHAIDVTRSGAVQRGAVQHVALLGVAHVQSVPAERSEEAVVRAVHRRQCEGSGHRGARGAADKQTNTKTNAQTARTCTRPRQRPRAPVHARTHMHARTRTHAHTHARAHMHMHACPRTHARAHTNAHAQVYSAVFYETTWYAPIIGRVFNLSGTCNVQRDASCR
jgi:hypothetical protein